MWAWSSNFYLCSATQYVNDMEMLISEYGPDGSKSRTVPVTFVFQTACGQKSTERNRLVYFKNDTIRNHCNTHGRILFDFNDLECYDPAGNYFGDKGADGQYTTERKLGDDCAYLSSSPGGSVYADRRNWGIDWMNNNPGTELTTLAGDNYCLDCAHSEGTAEGETKDNSRLHCALKGRAAWWLWASLAGWNEGQTPTSVYIQKPEIQKSLKNYPNPFTNGTLIEYQLIGNAKVKLSVWSETGQLVSVLVDNNQSKGIHQIPVSLDKNGVYFYTLDVDGQRVAKKMIKM